MKIGRRHLAKTITWRIIATSDTIILAYFITGDILSGFKIGLVEIITKMVLYYFHEVFWFNSKVKNYRIRHIIKTFSWRFVGTVDTMVISFFVTGSFLYGVQIGLAETLTKMLLYFLHEKVWYRINFGLDKHRKIVKKIFG